jgi:hypothetical protein
LADEYPLSKQITFLASIPPLMSAIQVDGSGGARIKIDVPETDIEAVTQLMALRGEVLRVTVVIDDGKPQRNRPE